MIRFVIPNDWVPRFFCHPTIFAKGDVSIRFNGKDDNVALESMFPILYNRVQLFKINNIFSYRFVKISNMNITNTLLFLLTLHFINKNNNVSAFT